MVVWRIGLMNRTKMTGAVPMRVIFLLKQRKRDLVFLLISRKTGLIIKKRLPGTGKTVVINTSRMTFFRLTAFIHLPWLILLILDQCISSGRCLASPYSFNGALR